MPQDRRGFLRGAALTAAGAQAVRGANDRVRVGVIGTGNRGAYVMRCFLSYPDVAVAAVCDVYQPNLNKAAAEAGSGAESYKDYRRVLERQDLDAVLVATPDHWHGPITVAACEAGKDVYVEKPVSNNLEDGRKMVEAARKHNRVVQVGLQQRSTPTFQEAARLIPELGRISHVALNFAGGYTRPVEEPQAPPEDLDWEMFQGPAPRRSYVPSRQRSWRGYYDYGGGLVSDWGVHLADVAHWYMGEPQPLTAAAAARYVRYQRPENDQVPDAFHIVWNCDKFVASFSNAMAPDQELPAWGTYFYGERGVLLVNRVGYWAKPVRRPARPGMPPSPPGIEPVFWKAPPNQGLDLGTRNHVRDFLDAVKSRGKPACDIETGFRSTVPTLLGVLSIRQGKTIAWDGVTARAS